MLDEPLHDGVIDSGLCCYQQNGVYFKQEQVTPNKWRWVHDEDAQKHSEEMEQKRRNLYWALRSRILTDDEMKEVERYGDSLVIEPMVAYYEPDKKRELNDALHLQFKMRLAK